MRVLIVFLLLCGSAWADWQPADMDFLETEYGYVPYPDRMVESGDSFYMVDNPKLVNRDNLWQHARRVRIRNIDVPHHGFEHRNHSVDLTCIYAIDRSIDAIRALKQIFRENPRVRVEKSHWDIVEGRHMLTGIVHAGPVHVANTMVARGHAIDRNEGTLMIWGTYEWQGGDPRKDWCQ